MCFSWNMFKWLHINLVDTSNCFLKSLKIKQQFLFTMFKCTIGYYLTLIYNLKEDDNFKFYNHWREEKNSPD